MKRALLSGGQIELCSSGRGAPTSGTVFDLDASVFDLDGDQSIEAWQAVAIHCYSDDEVPIKSGNFCKIQLGLVII